MAARRRPQQAYAQARSLGQCYKLRTLSQQECDPHHRRSRPGRNAISAQPASDASEQRPRLPAPRRRCPARTPEIAAARSTPPTWCLARRWRSARSPRSTPRAPSWPHTPRPPRRPVPARGPRAGGPSRRRAGRPVFGTALLEQVGQRHPELFVLPRPRLHSATLGELEPHPRPAARHPCQFAECARRPPARRIITRFGFREDPHDVADVDGLGALAQLVMRQLDRCVSPRRFHLNGQETRHQDQKEGGWQQSRPNARVDLDIEHGRGGDRSGEDPVPGRPHLVVQRWNHDAVVHRRSLESTASNHSDAGSRVAATTATSSGITASTASGVTALNNNTFAASSSTTPATDSATVPRRKRLLPPRVRPAKDPIAIPNTAQTIATVR